MDKFVCSICECKDNVVFECDSNDIKPDIFFIKNKKRYEFAQDRIPINFPCNPCHSLQVCLNCGWAKLDLESINKAINQLIKIQKENPKKKYMPNVDSSED